MRPDQEKLLARPFEPNEHKFKKQHVYISKSAIRRRLFEVDPRWTLTPPELVGVDGDVVTMRGGLTVCGITRYQIGTGIIQRKDAGGRVLEGYELALMVAKAYKEAATNILARAAVEFNCGAYLKDLDKDDRPANADGVKKMLQRLSHWGSSGGRERLSDMLTLLKLDWKTVSTRIEPGRTLESLLDTTLTEAEFMKRLVELSIEQTMKPATSKSAMDIKIAPKRIHCPTNLLEKDDVVEIGTVPGIPNSHTTRYRIIDNRGMIGKQIRLEVHNLLADKVETVHWGNDNQMLIAGPKCEAYAKDPSVCVAQASRLLPLWNGQFANATV